jgi:predicted permease
MTRFARLRSFLKHTVWRSTFESELQDELQLHIDLYEADLRRSGVPPAEARRRARAEFGGLHARKDECREAVGLRIISELRGDVRYALRLLRRSPAFTVVALLSLGLGVGANTAVFALVDTVLLKSLPVVEPEQLVFVDNSGGKSGGGNGPPYPCYELLRDSNRFLSAIAAFSGERFKVTIDGSPEQIRGQYASGGYFQTLGVGARLGRVTGPDDDLEIGRGGRDGAVGVISYDLWKRRFGLDPAVLGKSVQVGTTWVTIVGVSEPGFFGLQVGSPVDISVPMTLAGQQLRSKELWWLSVIGRLKPGATIEQARADLDGLFDGYMSALGQPRDRRTYFDRIELVPAARGLNELRRQFSEPLLIVMAIVGLVLVIGCANVANLLMARASARSSEMSVRLAIGASRGRLVRQLLTEGFVLVLCGAVMGLLFARWGVSYLVTLIGSQAKGAVLDPQFDIRVIGFTAGVATLTALLFSLAPALAATRKDVAGSATTSSLRAPKPRLRMAQILLTSQVLLTVVLLCGAALFVRTLQNLKTVDAGFDRAGVLTMQVDATVKDDPAERTAPDLARRRHAQLGAMWEGVVDRTIAVPGVTMAAAGTLSPLVGRDRGLVVAVVGRPKGKTEERGSHINEVTSGYFETVGIRLASGRTFTTRDRAGTPRVAILNETAARAWFAGEDPIGRKITLPGQRVPDAYEIVGVVGNARYDSMRKPDERMGYLPIEQAIDPISSVLIAVRGPEDVVHLAPTLRRIAAEAVPGGFVTRIATIEDRVQASLVRERLLSTLATFFAGLALALACIGLYGVMAYGVVRRTREIGIRIAVGARESSVVWLVMRDMLAIVTGGTVLGLAIAFVASQYVSSQLFAVVPGDAVATVVAIATVVTATAAVGYVPARRASRIDPVIALRHE